MMKLLGIISVLALSAGTADAGCTCQCVNGQMRPLCDSSMEIPPICPPTICPIMSPSIAPINPPTIPPIGTSQCQQAQVCDSFGNCRWQQICR